MNILLRLFNSFFINFSSTADCFNSFFNNVLIAKFRIDKNIPDVSNNSQETNDCEKYLLQSETIY